MMALPALASGLGMSAATASALSTAAAVVGGVSSFAESRYQAGVARNNSIIATQNANAALHTGAIEAQEQDLLASGELGNMLAQSGASGLVSGQGSMALRTRGAEQLANRDRGYITYGAETQAAGYRQQSKDYAAEAKGHNRAALFGIVEAGLNINSSMISSATQVKEGSARAIIGGRSVAATSPTRPRMRPA